MERNTHIKGRGTSDNPKNRFETIAYEPDPEYYDPDDPKPRTQYLVDTSKSIVSTNSSPDVGFEASINPYRGCEHGCVYCYARPYHEYLGFSSGLDFETKILVKRNAAELLDKKLRSRTWQPQALAMSGVTDPYQPIERKLGITRGCIEVLALFRNPVVIITKNHLVTRDIDKLQELAAVTAAGVFVSVTTLDRSLARTMEPRTSTPERRLDAIRELADAGVPVGVLVAPIVPGLTEHEIPSIIEACAEAGAQRAGYVMLRLPHQVKDLFEKWLIDVLPEHRDKVMNRIRSIRGGELNDPNFRTRMRGSGVHADHIASMFKIACRRHGMSERRIELSTDAFRVPAPTRGQLSLFD